MRSSEERRSLSNEKIKNMGITCYEQFPVIEDANSVKLKNIDEICKRSIASLILTQIACDIEQDNYEESIKFFLPMLKQFDVLNCLNNTEKKLLDGNYEMQDAINVEWEYECYWVLVWALGLIDDVSDATNVCDCDIAMRLVASCKNYDEFKSRCKLRDIEEVLDMLDLYYRFDWATTNKRIDSNTNIGNLNPEVVLERRRGLEWLISDENDWYDIQLNT